MSEIREVTGREVLDSRGWPTVEAEVRLEDGSSGRAAVPSGASTGRHEALELRDGNDRYEGRGVRRAVAHVREEIASALSGLDATEQGTVDRRLIELDGTEDKSRLGANAILAVSMACSRAAAEARDVPLFRYLGGEDARILPVPLMNLLNGGAHADNSVDMQEFMVVPRGFDRFSEALRAGAEIFHALRRRLEGEGLGTTVGDEGGVAPDLDSSEQGLEYLVDAVEDAGYRPGDEVALALDCAATELYDEEEDVYRLSGEGRTIDAGGLVDRYAAWAERYPLISIEDGLAEDDWEGWRTLTDRLGDRLQLVGDDLFVTNVARLRRGIEEGVANALLVKLNQIGTVSETCEAVAAADGSGYATVISHRSGETEDTFIADMAVATGSGQIKTGSACRSERVAKYNRLLRIEEELGERARFGREVGGG
jgi:enolase